MAIIIVNEWAVTGKRYFLVYNVEQYMQYKIKCDLPSGKDRQRARKLHQIINSVKSIMFTVQINPMQSIPLLRPFISHGTMEMLIL